jgi:hypothetical protein
VVDLVEKQMEALLMVALVVLAVVVVMVVLVVLVILRIQAHHKEVTAVTVFKLLRIMEGEVVVELVL